MAGRQALRHLRRDLARLEARRAPGQLVITGTLPAEEAEGLPVLEVLPNGDVHVVLASFGTPRTQAAGRAPRACGAR